MLAAPRKKATSRDRQRAATRERVYLAALAEFARVGVGAAQVSDIARAAAVAYGTFYTHFENKSAVLLECSRRTAARIRDGLGETPTDGYDDARSFFAAVGRAHLSAQMEAPVLRPEVWAAAVQQPSDPQHAHVAYVAGLVAALQTRGLIRQDRAAADIARAFLTSLLGFLARGAEPEEIELLADVFAGGVAEG